VCRFASSTRCAAGSRASDASVSILQHPSAAVSSRQQSARARARSLFLSLSLSLSLSHTHTHTYLELALFQALFDMHPLPRVLARLHTHTHAHTHTHTHTLTISIICNRAATAACMRAAYLRAACMRAATELQQHELLEAQ
jgi:hypothetical protein